MGNNKNQWKIHLISINEKNFQLTYGSGAALMMACGAAYFKVGAAYLTMVGAGAYCLMSAGAA